MDPLVSIGMPVYNCGQTLHLALRSLLFQTYTNWELILIDDGSTDNTLEVIRKYHDSRIRLVADNLHRGLSVRLNQAIQTSHGKYFGRMDGDDIAYPERLAKQVAFLEAHPTVDLVGTWVLVFNQQGQAVGKRAGPALHEQICRSPHSGFPIAHPTFLGKLAWFRHYCYDENALKAQDQDLLLRSYRYSHFANLQEVLLAYREEDLQLKKILKGRHYFMRFLCREYSRQGCNLLLIRALFEQVLKGLIDCIAVSTGLKYNLLRHRAQPITLAEQQEWEKVWYIVNR